MKSPRKANMPRYALGDQVRILATGETGTITQRCENATREPDYRVRVALPLGHSVFRPASESDLESTEERAA